jgi:hypothetical protein
MLMAIRHRPRSHISIGAAAFIIPRPKPQSPHLTDTDALPAPEIIAAEIADDLEAALEQFSKIAARLGQAAGANG